MMPRSTRRRGSRGLARRAALACAFAAACAAGAQAATYYVSPAGSDSASGSSSAPFKTLQAGVNKAGPGDTVVVEDGTYGPTGGQGSMGVTLNKAGTSSAWITLEAQHKGAAILDCQLVCHSYISIGSSAAYWIIRGFDIRNGYWGGIFSNSQGGKHMLIQGNLIHNIGNRPDSTQYGIMGIYADTGASDWKIDGNVFHDIGRTTNLTGNHDHGIYTHGSNSLIVNNVFYNAKNGWFVQAAAGFSGKIANNTFYGPDPILTKPGQIVLWSTESNVAVENNVFYDPHGDAIHNSGLSVSGSCTIDHNIVYSQSGSVGLFDATPSNCTISGNQLNVDPKLTDAAGLDFHLTSGSPAIDAGVTLAEVGTDFDGVPRPQGAGYDLGAFEYGAGAAPAPGTGGTTTITPAPGTGGTTITPTPAPSGSCVTMGSAWQNAPLTPQTGTFTAQWDATPSQAKLDGVMGLSHGAATGYSSLAAIVRFNNAGYIDARNGGAYAAASAIPYSAGLPYHFRLAVDIPNHTYSAYVAQGSNAEKTIGSGYAFRTEQAGATALDDLGGSASTGSMQVCSQTAAASAPAPATTAVSVLPGCATLTSSWRSVSMPAQTGAFTVQFDATPSASKIDGLVGLSHGAATGYTSLAVIVRFNSAGYIDLRRDGTYAAAAAIPYTGGTTYHFRVVVDLASHTYSAYVKHDGGTEQLLGSNYAFRTEQASVTVLDNVGLMADSGSETACAIQLTTP